MIVRPDAGALMAGDLGRWLGEQQDIRDATKAKAWRIQKWTVGAACVVAFIIVLLSPWGIPRALQIGFFIGVGGFGWAEFAKRPVIATIKTGINSAIARALEMDYALQASPGAELDDARRFDMLPSCDRSSFEDQWMGLVGDQSFQLYEAKLEEKRSNGKGTTWVTVFDGSIITLGFARRFHGVTLVERAGRRKRLFGLLGDAEEITLDGMALGRVDMVDPEFEDEFAIWSNDQVEARYLVHPEYVERLKAVEQAFAGEKVRALFKEGAMVIVLESGNLFESGSLDSSGDRDRLQQTIDQFGTLVDLAAKLNERPR